MKTLNMVDPESELASKLWELCLAKVDEIDAEAKANRTHGGSMRTATHYHAGSKKLSCHFVIFQNDGRSKLHIIEASEDAFSPGHYNTKVEVWWSDNDATQEARVRALKDEPDKHLIVNHKFYRLGDGKSVSKGFGGRTVKFKRLIDTEKFGLLRGDLEMTNDLWYSGPIPPAWRDRLPDNAVFLDGFDGPVTVY